MSEKERTLERDSEEWFINNLIGLADAEKQLFLSGKSEQINTDSLMKFIQKHATSICGEKGDETGN